LPETCPSQNSLNCDETCWCLDPSGILIWAETQNQNVAIEITKDEKASITAMATITADRTRLPLDLIAKRKTTRAIVSQLDEICIHEPDTMMRCLQSVSRTVRGSMKRKPLWRF
jgi:hypothetical protein